MHTWERRVRNSECRQSNAWRASEVAEALKIAAMRFVVEVIVCGFAHVLTPNARVHPSDTLSADRRSASPCRNGAVVVSGTA